MSKLTDSLTQNRLKELLVYDEETGLFRNKIKRWSSPKGKIFDIVNHEGYIIIKIDQVNYRANRLVFLYVKGIFPKEEVDHIDRNRSNNKLSNLRIVSHEINCRNRSMHPKNSSNVTGVHRNNANKKWDATITVSGKNIFLGGFTNIDDAIVARKDVEVKYKFI